MTSSRANRKRPAVELTLSPDVIDALDKWADHLSLTRSALVEDIIRREAPTRFWSDAEIRKRRPW